MRKKDKQVRKQIRKQVREELLLEQNEGGSAVDNSFYKANMSTVESTSANLFKSKDNIHMSMSPKNYQTTPTKDHSAFPESITEE